MNALTMASILRAESQFSPYWWGSARLMYQLAMEYNE